MIFIDNKYTKWYYAIVQNANLRVLPEDIYVEKHHIIPCSLDGDNSKENLVKLTAREHFVCHLLLTKMVTGPARFKMLSAVTRFQQKNIPNTDTNFLGISKSSRVCCIGSHWTTAYC